MRRYPHKEREKMMRVSLEEEMYKKCQLEMNKLPQDPMDNHTRLKLKNELYERGGKMKDQAELHYFFKYYANSNHEGRHPQPFPETEDNDIVPTYFDATNEDVDSNDTNVHSGHRMFDLHGYTTIGAEQALRAILTSVDRSRQNVIKINVGQGIHSQGGVGKLSDIVKKVAKDLQLPDPVRHAKNPGYLLMILPAIISSD